MLFLEFTVTLSNEKLENTKTEKYIKSEILNHIVFRKNRDIATLGFQTFI